jgi:DNA-binding beta-propeller fold protein YncE
MRTPTRAAAHSLLALSAVLCGFAGAGAAPAAAETLTQKSLPAGCIGEAPCTVGVETFMTQSVAVSPDGRHAYAVAWMNGALTIFDRLADGTLRQKPGIPGCFSSRAGELLPGFCAPVTAMRGAFSVAVSPDGRNVYVASLLSHSVAIFDRAADGTLTQKPGSAGCISDSGVVCADGVGLVGAQAVGISPDGASVYVAAAESGAIAVFDRAADGALTQKSGLDGCISESGSGPCADGRALTAAHGLATSRDGTSVYVVSADGVAVFDRHADGTLTQKIDEAGCVSETVGGGICALGRGLTSPSAVAVSPDGSGVYVSAGRIVPTEPIFGPAVPEPTVGVVAVFDRGAGGALTQKPGAAGCIATPSVATCADGRGLALTTGVALSPDGTSVYVLSRSYYRDYGVFFDGPGSIANFDRSADGSLTQPAGAAGCVSDAGAGDACSDAYAYTLHAPASLAISPDGLNAYVALAGGLAIFDRGAPRTLPPPPPPPPPPAPDVTGPALRGLAIGPARLRARARGDAVVARGGAKVSFRLSEPSIVRFRIQHITAGRRAGGRCAAPSRSNRGGRLCNRYHYEQGGFVHAGPAGANALRISGRLQGRRLARGRYRLRAVARDGAGNRSLTKTARFTIV